MNGHRILLQMLALEYPEFCVASISKSASLRNSYQNRPPIGLSLLWALGQGGNIDFGIGLQGNFYFNINYKYAYLVVFITLRIMYG